MRLAKGIDTRRRDAQLRPLVCDPASRSVLLSRIGETDQVRDLSAPTNTDGFGRVRHFRRRVTAGWPDNPLPIVPAARWLDIDPPEMMEAQVYQLAACAWRCWYCFVPYASLRADPTTSAWRSAASLVDAYLALDNPPPIIDLSGGSPDLAPEWILWTLEALEARGGSRSTFVWSDDNLSSDRLLDREGLALTELLAGYRNYGRVCCLKGFDGPSFAFNTRARQNGFERQMAILSAYARSPLDIYVYLPLVAPPDACPRMSVERVHERLAAIRADLPSRTVPLHIFEFGTMSDRLDDTYRIALARQWEFLEHWERLVPPGGGTG